MNNNKIIVKIKLEKGVTGPEYMTEFASGADIRANIEKDITIKPQQIKRIPTGIFLDMELCQGYEAQIRPKSGLASKGISVANCVGTIDNDYRGELQVLLVNLGNKDYVISPTMRMAQLVFCPVVQANFVKVEYLSDTGRGSGGFGSTGLN